MKVKLSSVIKALTKKKDHHVREQNYELATHLRTAINSLHAYQELKMEGKVYYDRKDTLFIDIAKKVESDKTIYTVGR